MTADADARLLAAYRPVRRVSAGEDVPWSGLLVRLPSGESRVLVDARELGDEWAGWNAPPEGHVVVPLDVVRRGDGHDVVLPVCVERVADFIVRRRARHAPLSVGETVTVGVSLLRGFGEWAAVGEGTGEWWLTDTGRPLLAPGAGMHAVADHTSDLLRTLAEGSPCAAALDAAADAVAADRVAPHDLRDAEDALFDAAAAEPLATQILSPSPAPVSVGEASGPRMARDLAATDRVGVPGGDRAEPANWVDTIARHVDADLADAVSRATTGLWRRVRAPRAAGRRPWMLAAGAAAVVLGAGFLWPTGAGTAFDAAAEYAPAAGPAPIAVDAPTPASSVAAEEAVTDPSDLEVIADGLLTARLACAGDATCLAKVAVDPAAVFAAGAIDLASADRRTTLLDDFGGVAVLRVDAVAEGAGEAQLVVVMLHDGQWLLRDVHAAKQP